MLPFFRKIVAGCAERELLYLLALFVAFFSVVPMLKELGMMFGFYIPFANIYPFYFFAGHYLVKYGKRKSKALYAILALGCTGIICGITVLQYAYSIPVPETLTNYASVIVIIQSISVFKLLTESSFSGESLPGKILLCLDQNSFAIYLIHMIFIRIVLRVWNYNPLEKGPSMMLALIIGNLILSWSIAFVLKKIPGIRKVL